MNDVSLRYRATILRAAFGPNANQAKVHDLHQLNQLCEHLAECEQAQEALRARGYGRAGMSFIEVVRDVPINALGRIKNLFAPRPVAQTYPDLNEVHDIWTPR